MTTNEQRSIEWRKERLGRVTASRLSDVLGSVSARASYARQLRHEAQLLARINAGEQVQLDPDFYSSATAWGEKHEPEARSEYEWRNNVTVAVPRFRVHGVYPFIGCSVDGIVLESDGAIGLEIKCPFDQLVHANTLAHGVPADHRPQIHGEIWVCGLEAVDFVSYDPRSKAPLDYFERRVMRDDKYIAHLESKALEFWDFVKSGKDYPEDASATTVPVLF